MKSLKGTVIDVHDVAVIRLWGKHNGRVKSHITTTDKHFLRCGDCVSTKNFIQTRLGAFAQKVLLVRSAQH
ncbi:MAG: hypothetical protein UX22_C0020G0007 [Candidatus Jorgensenbacteria bacterium GW2011_GWA2_45_9]|uniref:Uncharacterized protein n=1 Tax=Candidatus Jorgensenbacteria bacterium GW2011_GWA2_45_9 TaxID=1618663 RepID=A0A0G1QA54_9BACT|nr:MAG: hypothetical protein UX22_C0020G0007 [Candidatus Jorgensenbacteria bacterium GW2011_GWA2_45_9]